jgi:hypothetical protein
VPVRKDSNSNPVGDFVQPIEPIRGRDSRSKTTARHVLTVRTSCRLLPDKAMDISLPFAPFAHATSDSRLRASHQLIGGMTLVPVWNGARLERPRNSSLVDDATDPIEPTRVRDQGSNPTARYQLLGRRKVRDDIVSPLTRQSRRFHTASRLVRRLVVVLSNQSLLH